MLYTIYCKPLNPRLQKTIKHLSLTAFIVVTSQILTVPSKEAVAKISQLSGWNSQENIVSV